MYTFINYFNFKRIRMYYENLTPNQQTRRITLRIRWGTIRWVFKRRRMVVSWFLSFLNHIYQLLTYSWLDLCILCIKRLGSLLFIFTRLKMRICYLVENSYITLIKVFPRGEWEVRFLLS